MMVHVWNARMRVGLLAVSMACGVAAQGQNDPGHIALGHIPPVRGTLLSGQAVSLPEALRGRAGVLVIGFSQESREDVANWGRRLGTDYFDSNSVAYYELAMLAEVPRFLRGLVTRKIKDQVSPRGQQHFLPIVEQEDGWKAAAGYNKSDSAYVLLVDGTGAVVWKTGGPLTGTLYAELQSRMQSLAR